MKKVFCVLLAISCFFLSSCIKEVVVFTLQAYERNYEKCKTEFLIEGQFFDEKFMKKAELSWLEKPDGKDEILSSKDYEYTYQGNVLDKTLFDAFLTNLYENFNALDYELGGQEIEFSGGFLSPLMSIVVKKFLSLEEHKLEGRNEYVFYYSAQGTEWDEKMKCMRIIEAKKLVVSGVELENMCQIEIKLFTQVAPVYVEYDLPPFVKD